MASRRAPSDLPRLLKDLAAHLEEPPRADLVAAVRARIEAEARHKYAAVRTPRWRSRTRTLRLALAGLVLASTLSGVLTLSPATRRAVADWLGVRGVRIEQPNEPTPTALGGRLALGDRVSLAEASQRVTFDILLPPTRRFGRPDEVYVADTPSGGRVTLLYQARAGLPPAPGSDVGLLLTEFRAEIPDEVIRKTVGTDTRLEQLTIDGSTGFWIDGQPHALTFADENGRFFKHKSRLAGNTLVLERGPLTLRLESGLTKDQALRVEQSLQTIP